MESIPLWAHLLALVVLLLVSAFFSIAETSMMALNRYRLGHLVRKGRRGARQAAELLRKPDTLLGTVLLGNNLVNTAVTAIVTALAIRNFGNNDSTLLVATTVVALLIIVFCEITPKVIGATYPEHIALPSSYLLTVLVRLSAPVVWSVNLLVGALLKLARTHPGEENGGTRMTTEELRTIVLESGAYLPGTHRQLLVNLFDLEHITVDDVMTPRNRVESLDLSMSPEDVRAQLATCYHNKLPVHDRELNQVVGMLHVRRTLSLLGRPDFSLDDLRELLTEPYFVPSGTPVFTQLRFFQKNRQRLALVVDEYGDVLGLLTLEDIIEELIGQFTTTTPGGDTALRWSEDRDVLLEGATSLRELNRHLGTSFPLDGPRTLAGLVLEALQDFPEGDVSVRFGTVAAEVLQTEGRSIRSVRLRRLDETP